MFLSLKLLKLDEIEGVKVLAWKSDISACQEPLKWSRRLIWVHFRSSLTHLGASRGLWSQNICIYLHIFCIYIYERGPFWDIFWPSLTPPIDPVNFFGSKMAWTCVLHIVLYVLCWTRVSGGYFRLSEIRFRGIFTLSGNWFYEYIKAQKTYFFQFSPTKLASFLYMKSFLCPPSPCKILQMAVFGGRERSRGGRGGAHHRRWWWWWLITAIYLDWFSKKWVLGFLPDVHAISKGK